MIEKVKKRPHNENDEKNRNEIFSFYFEML